MTAACWFNYLLVFLIQVTQHTTTHAALIMLAGQVADAIATPLVGLLSDRTKSRFGRRKLWLSAGAILVNISFFFVFSDCYICHAEPLRGHWFHIVYWAILASIFNIGWAAVQVSHMSLVPEISHDENERTRLNSARYAGGIVATLLVLGIAWAAFDRFGISPTAFHVIAISSIVLGDTMTLIFLIGVKEDTPSYLESKRFTKSQELVNPPVRSRRTWRSWFRVPMFYQVAVVYMFSRITVNISQVFMPFYLQFSLDLSSRFPSAIAIVPLVVMGTSFTTTFFLKRLNRVIGRRSAYVLGTLFSLVGLIPLLFLPAEYWYLIFVIALFLGIGTTTVLVTSISMEADLVGTATSSGAFVYGALSFTDKLSNGLLIQLTSVYTGAPDIIRWIISAVPGGACVLAALASFTIVDYYRKNRRNIQQAKQPLLSDAPNRDAYE
eukprot:TRINITY_DN6740_c1_g2_i3.p1 TRINITY_DN6740_c1_g2~~TRINITY_DN6740_c1_g2_i3.p1  ORF type:complete len:503 (+),score=55.01 TRINITY_DN6740_c1_g2_i3:198-1511(+)